MPHCRLVQPESRSDFGEDVDLVDVPTRFPIRPIECLDDFAIHERVDFGDDARRQPQPRAFSFAFDQFQRRIVEAATAQKEPA